MADIVFILLFFLVLKASAFLSLECLNLNYLSKNSKDLPLTVEGIMDNDTFVKSVNYTRTKTMFSCISSIYDSAILCLVLIFSLIPWLYEVLTNYFGQGYLGQSLVFIISVSLFGLPSLPFSWWSTFKIEEAFGFNKSTLKLWITDQVKGFTLAIIIGTPLFMALMWIVNQMGNLWWIWAFLFFWGFQILMIVIYPMYIMPLFNKLEPMESGELKDRLLELGNRCGFQSKTILVMDGSKRSGHSNAFFTGFGSFRRIVLYDTLIDQMEINEIEAVLAHEIGHYKCGHIPKRLAFSAISSFLMFAFIAWLIQSKSLFIDLGFSPEMINSFNIVPPFVPAFLLLSLFAGLFTFWFSPLDSLWSRKHEYEADSFAKSAIGSPVSLKSALRKLYKENLSNLIPHPIYSAFYYSHPTIVERESALNEN